MTTIPVLLITGPVGVGKTSVASEVSERLDQAGIAHALVDVEQREPGLGRERTLRRAAELATQMDENPVEDFLIETDERTIPEIAQEVLARCGWLAEPPA